MPRPTVKSAKRNANRFSRPPLARMVRLHERLKAGEFPNCRKLAGELEVSSKTIQRDIDFMRDRLGVSPEVKQHLANSRVEFLKAVRAVIDERIERISAKGQQGTKIAVE